MEHLERLVAEGVDIAWDAFPYVGGNTTLVVFMPPWTLPDLHTAVTDPEQRARTAATLNWVLPHLGMRWEDTQILWVPKPECRHYEGMTVAEIASERGTDPTETYLDLVGELGMQARIMNWNYSGRDDEEASLRKVLQHSRTLLRDRHDPHRQRLRQPGVVRHVPAVAWAVCARVEAALADGRGASHDEFLGGAHGPAATAAASRRGWRRISWYSTRRRWATRPHARRPVGRRRGSTRWCSTARVVVREGRFDRASRAGRVLRRGA